MVCSNSPDAKKLFKLFVEKGEYVGNMIFFLFLVKGVPYFCHLIMTLKTEPFENSGKMKKWWKPVDLIFSFSHNFYPFREKLHHLSHNEIGVCTYFKFLKG